MRKRANGTMHGKIEISAPFKADPPSPTGKGVWMPRFTELQKGQAIKIRTGGNHRAEKSIRVAAGYAQRRLGHKFTVRRVGDGELQVWRLK